MSNCYYCHWITKGEIKMKRLNKRSTFDKQSVQAYISCYCSMLCSCSDLDGMIFSGNQSRDESKNNAALYKSNLRSTPEIPV